MHDSLEDIFESLDESIEESELDVASAALEYAWNDLPDEETQWEEYDEETWMLFEELQQARLNVLERQGRTSEFLQLVQKADTQRYTLKLIQLGRIDAAVAASRELVGEHAIHSVAHALRDAGRPDDAIALAEGELNQENNHGLEFAAWLAPLEETRGNHELALHAYRIAFDAQPSITWYRHLKRLSGDGWQALRPALIKIVTEGQNPDTLADIYLEEGEWDSAIAIAVKSTWYPSTLEKVADGLIPYRPDWVIRVSLKQSDQLIAKTQSKLYPEAANWLSRAKKGFLAKGQTTEWLAYIAHLRDTYARRPALQKAIANL